MFLLKLSLTTVWMAGVVRGWSSFTAWHLLAVAVVALVLVEGTALERRIAGAISRVH